MAGLVADADTVVQGEDFRRKKYYEVLFRGEFTQKEPWGDTPENGISWVARHKGHLRFEELRTLELPIQSLSHITHNKQAQEIERGSDFIFEAWPKKGKVMGNVPDRPYGESFIKFGLDMEYMYKKVSGSERVLPGCYSWWGIHLETVEWDRSVEVKAAVRVLECENIYVANYLKFPPESRYGNNEFYTNLSDLLMSYGWSRSCSVRDIYLKVGGTLRYLNEIAYVIIICTQNDLDDLDPFPNIHHMDKQIFDPKDLVNSEGSVANLDAVPTFKPKYVIRFTPGCFPWEGQDLPTYYSWEGLNFAFYFPEGLKCPRHVVARSEIKHPLPACASRKRTPGSRHSICPNQSGL